MKYLRLSMVAGLLAASVVFASAQAPANPPGDTLGGASTGSTSAEAGASGARSCRAGLW